MNKNKREIRKEEEEKVEAKYEGVGKVRQLKIENLVK